MKIAVVCANGRVGKLVVKEAIDRGLDVTAIARGENKTTAKYRSPRQNNAPRWRKNCAMLNNAMEFRSFSIPGRRLQAVTPPSAAGNG